MDVQITDSITTCCQSLQVLINYQMKKSVHLHCIKATATCIHICIKLVSSPLFLH